MIGNLDIMIEDRCLIPNKSSLKRCRMKPHIPVLMVSSMLVVLLVGFALTPPRVVAQDSGTPDATEVATEAATQTADNSCTDFVKQALAATNKACAETGRNQACYGSVSIKAEAQSGVADFQFDQPGKIVNVADIKTLQLSALNADDNTWGVALMRLQANLPGTTAGQYVTMLVFGDVQIQSAVTPPKTLQVTVSTATNALSIPVNGRPVGKLAANASTTATGRLKDDSWLRVQVPGRDPKTSLTGWIAVKSIPSDVNVDSLDVVDPTAPVYGPMQAFYFQTGIGQQACQAAPPNGVLIQTPRGGPRIVMVMNDAKLTMNGSAFVNSDKDMTISTFNGSVSVEAKGQTQVVPAGQQVELPLASNGKVSGPPEKPTTFKAQDFASLTVPLQSLPVPSAPSSTTQTSTQNITPGGVCPAGVAYKTVVPSITVNGVTVPGRTVVAPCHCGNGSHTISSSAGGVNVSVEICD